MNTFLLLERSSPWCRGTVLAAGMALLSGCSDSEGNPGEDGGGQGGASVQEAASSKTLRFEEPRRDLSDLGLGEQRSYRLKVLAEGEGQTPQISVVESSCGCLGGRLIRQDETGAEIEVLVDGYEPEDIDGVITLRDADRKPLAEHVATIVITSRTFVQPREVVVTPDSREIALTIGHGFGKNVVEPPFITQEPVFDEAILTLIDWVPDRKLELEYLLMYEVLTLELVAEAFESAGSTVVKLGGLEPEEKSFEVTIRWDKAD